MTILPFVICTPGELWVQKKRPKALGFFDFWAGEVSPCAAMCSPERRSTERLCCLRAYAATPLTAL